MFKHTLTYNDFNGTERNEELYFHLSMPEMVRLEAEMNGLSLKQHIEKLTADQNMKALLDFLERIILSSYGQKTSDGKSFFKSQALRDEFEYSQAYAELFEQLLINQDLARKFGESVADDGKNRKNQVAPTVVNA